MDHDGYGYSGSSGNNSDIASSVEDLKAAIPVVAQETGQTKMHFYGTSSGAIRAAAYAQVEPARVDRLVLVAFTYKGTGAPEIGNRARAGRDLPQQQSPQARRRHDPLDLHPRRPCLELRSGGARGDHRGHGDCKFGDQVPTGTYLDMAANLPLVDPKKVLSPVLMIRGIHDGNSTTEDLLDFYPATAERRPPVRDPAAHRALRGYSNNRHLLWYATRNFLAAPAAVPAS